MAWRVVLRRRNLYEELEQFFTIEDWIEAQAHLFEGATRSDGATRKKHRVGY